MNFLQEAIRSLILRLYNKVILQTDTEINQNDADVYEYENTHIENVTAMVANTLATYAFGDSTITITGDNSRALLLREISERHLENFKSEVAYCLGTGLLVSVPYSVSGSLGRKIYISTVPKNRFFVTGVQGNEITQCTVIADYRIYQSRTYIRFTDYSIKDKVYTIRTRVTCDGKTIDINSVEWWKDIPEEMAIGNVDRLPIAIMRCPAPSRRAETISGVPITHGCSATLKKIEKTLSDIEEEFDGKKTLIFADESLFDKNMKISARRFVKTESDKGDFYEVFSPEIHQSAYYEKLVAHFAMLEKEIGCSAGVLTELVTSSGTATEVRKKMYKTFALCDDIQKRIKSYYEDLMYAVNVLADYFNLTPPGEYGIDFSWSYGLLEDSTETVRQYKEGMADGVISRAEYRQQLTGETLDDAKAAVDEIKQSEPSLSDMLGINNDA